MKFLSYLRLSDTPSRQLVSVTGFALVALTFAALFAADQMRGPWYDEFYTNYVAGGHFPFLTALKDHWLPDNHPPLFYVLFWAMRWIGTDIEGRRIINLLIGLAFLLLARPWLGRTGPGGYRLIFFLALLVCQEPLLDHGTEIRSYFLTICSLSLLTVALVDIYVNGFRGERLQRWSLYLAVFTALNTHIIATIYTGAGLFMFLAALLIQRRFADFRAVAIPAVIFAMLFLILTAIQMRSWALNTHEFWIPAGFSYAQWTLRKAAWLAVTSNLVLLVAGGAGLALLTALGIRRRERRRELDAAILLLSGVALASATVLVLNSFRPIVLIRYLVTIIPPLMMVLAIGADHLASRIGPRFSPWLLVLATLASLGALYGNYTATAKSPGWAGTAQLIGASAARCRDLAVHTDPYWNDFAIRVPPPDNAAVIRQSYRIMAARNHFRIEPEGSLRISPICPTVFWGENQGHPFYSDAEILDHVRKSGFPVERLSVYRMGWGFVASTQPLAPAASDQKPPAQGPDRT